MLCTALPFTFDGVTPTVSKAHAVIGRPLTPMSVAGVHRRAMRRTYGVGANVGYHPVARAALYGAAATGAAYYGAAYSSPSYGYGTAYNPPGPFTPAFGGTNGYGGYGYPAYGYGTGYGYHPVARAALYGAAATGEAATGEAATGAGYYGAGYGGWGNGGWGNGYGYGAPSYAGFGWGGGYSQEPIKSAVLDEAMQKSCMDRTYGRGPCEITGQ